MDADKRYALREVVVPDGESMRLSTSDAEDPLISETFSKAESADGVVDYRLFALRYAGPNTQEAELVKRRQLGTLRIANGKITIKQKVDTRLVALLSALLLLWTIYWIQRAVKGWR